MTTIRLVWHPRSATTRNILSILSIASAPQSFPPLHHYLVKPRYSAPYTSHFRTALHSHCTHRPSPSAPHSVSCPYSSNRETYAPGYHHRDANHQACLSARACCYLGRGTDDDAFDDFELGERERGPSVEQRYDSPGWTASTSPALLACLCECAVDGHGGRREFWRRRQGARAILRRLWRYEGPAGFADG